MGGSRRPDACVILRFLWLKMPNPERPVPTAPVGITFQTLNAVGLFFIIRFNEESALLALLVDVNHLGFGGRGVAGLSGFHRHFGFHVTGRAINHGPLLAHSHGVFFGGNRDLGDSFALGANVVQFFAGLKLPELSGTTLVFPVLRTGTGIGHGGKGAECERDKDET